MDWKRRVLAMLVLIAPSVTAAPPPDPEIAAAHAAIARLVENEFEQWTYRRTLVGRDEVWIDEHDPSRPGAEHWQLVSVNGREPTADEHEEYLERRVSHEKDPRDRLELDDFADMLVPGSLALVARDDARTTYTFALQSPNGRREHIYRKLAGELSVTEAEDGPMVERVSVRSTEPFFPIFGFRLETFAMDLTFTEHRDTVIPVQIDVVLEGRALLLKRIGRDVQVAFSHLQPPAP